MKIKNDGASGLTELKSKLKEVRSTGKEPTHSQPSQRFRSRRPAKISCSELKPAVRGLFTAPPPKRRLQFGTADFWWTLRAKTLCRPRVGRFVGRAGGGRARVTLPGPFRYRVRTRLSKPNWGTTRCPYLPNLVEAEIRVERLGT